jgi:transposase-like protein
MNLHKNAKLLPNQRQQIKDLYATGEYSQEELALRFGVSRPTISKWVKRQTPADGSSAPKHHGRRTITPEFEQAVKEYRQNPATAHHGKVRIALALRDVFACSSSSNVYLVLKKLQLNVPKQARSAKKDHIPVGKHRTQMDVQYLPALKGASGFSYKISIIHLSTRYKYSEIHDTFTSETIAGVYKRACDALPPFSSRLPITP